MYLGSFIPPILTTIVRDTIISPKVGEMIFNSTTGLYNFWNGSTWESLTSPGNIDPGDVGGGAKAMILAFTGNNVPYVETTSNTYSPVGCFVYSGSTVVKAFTEINVAVHLSGGGSGDIRIFDVTNNLVIGEFLGVTSTSPANIENIGVLSNIPLNKALIEVQIRKVTGGGGAKMRTCSIEIIY